MKKNVWTLSLAFLFFYIITPQAALATCLSQCKAEHSSFVEEKSNKIDARAYLTFLCRTRCKTNFCNAKSVSEYLLEYKPYTNPDCVKEDLAGIDVDALRANKAKLMAETQKSADEAEARMRDLQRQPAPQARTQTSQNNSPSDSSYEQSRSNSSSNSSVSRSGTGNDAKNCVQVTRSDKGHPGFRNVCNFNITVKYCVVDHDCRGNPGFSRMSNLSPGGKTNAYADPHQDVRYGACQVGQSLDDSANDGSYVCKIR